MCDAFRHYYPPSQSDWDSLWRTGTVVPDTNVLLDLYRVSANTRNSLLDALRKLNGRLWLPHQVGLEYHRNRLTVIHEEHAVYRELLKITSDASERAHKRLATVRSDSVVDKDALQSAFDEANRTIKQRIEAAQARHPASFPDAATEDPVLDALSELFEGKTGLPYSTDELKVVHEEARKRYESEIPPGYLDANKRIGDPLGDYIRGVRP